MSCPNITNGMNYCFRTKSVSLKYNKKERLVLYGKQLSPFVLLMRVRGTYQGWLEPLVNIDMILLPYGVDICLGCSCDMKLNQIINMTVDPSIGNLTQRCPQYYVSMTVVCFREVGLCEVSTHTGLKASFLDQNQTPPSVLMILFLKHCSSSVINCVANLCSR